MPSDREDLLARIADGDSSVADHLLEPIYDELRSLARQQMGGEHESVLLQPTALVHEVFLRMVDKSRVTWKGRAHFLALAAKTMRRILIEHWRARRRQKRGGDLLRITLDEAVAIVPARTELDFLALDEALVRLGTLNAREARVVELRIFAGLSIDETAEVLAVSPRTVDEDWAMAKAWLRAQLQE